MRNGRLVLDADTHQMEPASLWQDYMAPEYRDRGPRVGEIDGMKLMTVEGEPLVRRHTFPFPEPRLRQRATGMLTRVRIARFGAAARVADMDEQGVDVQVLFPTVGAQMLGREFHDVGLLAACCRAYNDWTADYVAEAPDRLRWIAVLPLQEVSLAVEEARHAAAQGATGFLVRPNPIRGRNLYDPEYEPLWTELERLGIPACLHDTSSPRLASYGDRMMTHTSGHILSHPFEAMAAMMSLIWYGVAERHPRLRIIHAEADAGWLPYWLQRMGQHYEQYGAAEHPELTMAPAEYFRRNFFVICRGDEVTLPSVVSLVGDDRLLFHTDYPHGDSTWPGGMQALEAQPIPADSLRRIFWDNALAAFSGVTAPSA